MLATLTTVEAAAGRTEGENKEAEGGMQRAGVARGEHPRVRQKKSGRLSCVSLCVCVCVCVLLSEEAAGQKRMS